VKYHSQGESALEACAEELTRGGRDFAGATRDRSRSLDEIRRRFRLGEHRALLRGAALFPEGLVQRRARLAARWAERDRRPWRRREARSLPDLSHVYRVRVPRGQRVEEVIDALARDPHVEYVQRDYRLELDGYAPPNDPYFGSFGSWGQPHSDLWGLERVAVTEVWPRGQGEGSIVAVVDTGLDPLHPDIADNVWVNPGEDLDADGVAEAEDANGIDDDGNGYVDDLTGFDFSNSQDLDEDGLFDGPADLSDSDPFDDNGHGTHVAGTIAAVGNNGLGIVGIAPRARIMALKGFPADGSGTASTLWQAVLYAAANGATVINNSWSCSGSCPDNPLAEEVLEIVDALGAVVVTSAGNASSDVVFRNPENGPGVITVGSIGVDDRLSGFSNRGWLVDVVGPGGGPSQPDSVYVPRRNILSLLSRGTSPAQLPFAVGEGYLRLAGTSMSAPHVTGAVAVLRSLRPDLTPRDVRRLVRISARDLGVAGHDARYGAGLLDVAKLVDTPLPDLALEISSPRPGLLHDPADGALEIRGRAFGSDLESIEVEVGRGLEASEFSPVAPPDAPAVEAREGRGDTRDGVLARWAVSELPDGPRVVRVRARLRDGRSVEEHTIVGLERNPPVALSSISEETGARAPALSGRRVLWQVDEDESSPATHDLVVGTFPRSGALRTTEAAREPRRLLEREGDQRDAVIAGREIAWLSKGPDGQILEHCRLDGGSREAAPSCDPTPVATGPGPVAGLWLAEGRLAWMRIDGRTSVVEGCRIGPAHGSCEPRGLIDPAAEPGWKLRSFDGETLLLARGTTLARCALGARAERCMPETIELAPGSPSPLEAVLDGDLMVFKEVSVDRVPPAGCPPGDPSPECAAEFVVMRQLHACWLGETPRWCSPTAIGEKAPVLGSAGLSLSGRRVVWAASSPGELPALRFCEFVPQTGACEAQRIGGAPSAQTAPMIDAQRVVWVDGRSSPAGIHGLELPRLFVSERVSLHAGRDFSLPLSGVPGSSGELRFELEPLQGVTPAAAKARIVPLDRRGQRARLRGRVPDDLEGRALWRIRAIGGGGLFSERVVEVSIVPARGASPFRSRAEVRAGGRSEAHLIGFGSSQGALVSRLTPILEDFFGLFARPHDHVVAGGEPAGGIGEGRVPQ
jgi:subtilisin family serine protease